MQQSKVLSELENMVLDNSKAVKHFTTLSKEILEWAPTPKKWNILQCIEHLNRYGTFYLAEFTNVIHKAAPSLKDDEYQEGYWGKKFTKGMLPSENMKTMNTFKDKNPSFEEASLETLTIFLEQQETLLDLLKKAQGINLNKNKCRLTIPLLKMRLGDTLRFYIYHQVRHIAQANVSLNGFKQN